MELAPRNEKDAAELPLLGAIEWLSCRALKEMSDASESVLVGTRYTNWKSGTRNVFEDHETEYSNKYVKKNSQNTTNSSGAGMRRTYSCPLFVLLKQDALEGKKVSNTSNWKYLC